jgi:hypothetical protein
MDAISFAVFFKLDVTPSRVYGLISPLGDFLSAMLYYLQFVYPCFNGGVHLIECLFAFDFIIAQVNKTHGLTMSLPSLLGINHRQLEKPGQFRLG